MKINIVIPMAGAGSRFANEGYDLPKPFVDIAGKMMIERVLDGLKCKEAKYTLVIQEKFLTENKNCLDKLSKNYELDFVTVECLTAGASCTALASHKIINNDIPVVFADSDNIFADGILQNFINDALARKLDGSLLTFQTKEDCFSFVGLNENGFAISTAEKNPISTNAITGIYYFGKGSDFVDQAINMMIYNDKIKGEFYMSNVYNWMIKASKKVGVYDIKGKSWNCVGTPVLLKNFLKG